MTDEDIEASAKLDLKIKAAEVAEALLRYQERFGDTMWNEFMREVAMHMRGSKHKKSPARAPKRKPASTSKLVDFHNAKLRLRP